MPHESSPIPGVDEDELAAVARGIPSLPNLRAGQADRFAQAVRTLVEDRAQAGWPEESEEDFAAFVFVEIPRLIGEQLNAPPVTDLIATGEGLLGRIFFLNRDGSNGRAIPLPVGQGAILDWLEDQGLGQRPLVFVYRRTAKLITRRYGGDGEAIMDPIRPERPIASVDELRRALDFFHRRQATPIYCARGVWAQNRAGDYIPGALPEKALQHELGLTLSTWFHGVLRVDTEDSTAIGRIDVRLLKLAATEGSLTYWAIIELKLIKSFAHATSGNRARRVTRTANVDAIAEGVRQASAFWRDRHAEEGLLEIFDLRKEKAEDLLDMPSILELVSQLEKCPHISVRPLFGSAHDARIAGFDVA